MVLNRSISKFCEKATIEINKQQQISVRVLIKNILKILYGNAI